jgi:hypothetical protein
LLLLPAARPWLGYFSGTAGKVISLPVYHWLSQQASSDDTVAIRSSMVPVVDGPAIGPDCLLEGSSTIVELALLFILFLFVFLILL